MTNCQHIRVPFRNWHSDQGFRHQVRHRQFRPNVNPVSDSEHGFKYSSETCQKALANSVPAMLAKSRWILRVLGGKKDAGFSSSFTTFLRRPVRPDEREQGADNETGDHFAEVAEAGREYVAHFTHVSAEGSVR